MKATTWGAYLRFVKFHYHGTFLGVIFAASIFAAELNTSLLKSLVLLYLSFNILLYGGLYTINDIADLASDEKHRLKKNRPLPSGMISIKSALLFSLLLLAAGLLGGFVLFDRSIFYAFLAFIALNLFYSFHARNVPYLELLVNSSTYPLRFLIGVLLVGREVPYFHLLAFYFLAFGFVCLRRFIEMEVEGWQARETLMRYSQRKLLFFQTVSFLAILLLFVNDDFVSKGFYFTIIATYLVLTCGTYFSGNVRNLAKLVWTR